MDDYVYREYLKFTDWFVNRKDETGKEIPLKVLMRRDYARNQITSNATWATDFDLVFGDVDAEYESLVATEEDTDDTSTESEITTTDT